MKVMNWYPLLTLPLFVFMGYMLSESGIADGLYRMFHVWFGPGARRPGARHDRPDGPHLGHERPFSVAGMAIGATIALPELLRRGYDKMMVTGVIQAGSSLGILIPPSVVLVLYAMIARAAGQSTCGSPACFPGLLMALIFAAYVYIRCLIQPSLGPVLPKEERDAVTRAEKFRLLRAGIMPLAIFFSDDGLFLTGVTSLVESSAVGALPRLLAAAWWAG
jgi:TRAP-type mannitol/chloroaromatic compound transport system permease large subunit